MANEGLKEIYEQVVEEVKKHPEIRSLERGILYKIIQIIVREEHSETQQITRVICERLGIKPNSHRDDDYRVVKDLAETIFIDRQPLAGNIPMDIKDKISDVSMKIIQMSNNNEGNIKWIILAACTLVGVFFCVQYLEETKKKKRDGQERLETSKSSAPPPIPAALCLVVPEYLVSDLKNGSNLSVDDLMKLIDNASYFLCTTIKNAKSNEENLELLPNKSISSESKQDVYLRININDGRETIDKTVPYILKKNLPSHGQGIVEKIACLKNLSGLEKFNRI